jgi:ABC-2 type transport system permease protein
MRQLWAFFLRDLLNETSYRLSFLLQVAGSLAIVLMFYFLSNMLGDAVARPLGPYGGNYFAFVLIGIAVQNYLMAALNAFSGSLRESQLSGSLEAVFAAPVSLPVFLLGSASYGFGFNAFRVPLYLGAGSLLFGVRFHWQQFPPALLVMALTIAAFLSLGLFSAAFIILFKKGDPLNWVISVASWLLGGVYYPVSILPEWLQKLALLIPMTHCLESLRKTLICNEGLSSIGGHVLLLGIWGLIGLPLAMLSCRIAFECARRKGSLSHY